MHSLREPAVGRTDVEKGAIVGILTYGMVPAPMTIILVGFQSMAHDLRPELEWDLFAMRRILPQCDVANVFPNGTAKLEITRDQGYRLIGAFSGATRESVVLPTHPPGTTLHGADAARCRRHGSRREQ